MSPLAFLLPVIRVFAFVFLFPGQSKSALIILLVCSQDRLLLTSLNIIFHSKKPGLLGEAADSGAATQKAVSSDQREGRVWGHGTLPEGAPLAKGQTI